MGEFPSGQRGQTVNLLVLPSVVRIHLLPLPKYSLYRLSYSLLNAVKRISSIAEYLTESSRMMRDARDKFYEYILEHRAEIVVGCGGKAPL